MHATDANPLRNYVIRQHRDYAQTALNDARYARWVARREAWLRARAEGLSLRFPLELVEA